MNKVSKIAQEVSETVISVILSAIGIISAIPELIGTSDATGDFFFALAVAATGVGSVHVAVLRGVRWLWIVFALHIVFLEITLVTHEAYAEMTYPIFTAIGAVVMVQFMEYSREAESKTKKDTLDQEASQYEREQKFALELELKRKREEAKINNKYGVSQGDKSVSQSVSQSVSDTLSASSEEQSVKQQLDSIVRHLMDTGDAGASGIAKATGLSRSTVYRRVEELISEGKIAKIGSKFSADISPVPQLEIHTNGTSFVEK